MLEQIVKTRMTLLGLSQKDLAEKANLTTAQISSFYNGKALSQKSLESIFSILEINMSIYEKRYELAMEVADILRSHGISEEEIISMSKKKMATISGKKEVMLFFDIKEDDYDASIESGIVDYESTFVFFKAMVLQMVACKGKFSPSSYLSSWNTLTSSKALKTAGFMTLGAAVGLGAIFPLGLIGLSAIWLSSFKTNSLMAPFNLLAKSLLKKEN